MGSSFVNYQVKSDSQSNAFQAISKLAKRKAYVSPSVNGWVSIYDEASEEEMNYHVIHYINQQISLDLSSPVLAIIVYSDLYFIYFLYENGVCVDEYHSDPEGFPFGFDLVDEGVYKKFKGDFQKLLKYCKAGTSIGDIANILQSKDEIKASQKGLPTAWRLAELLNIEPEKLCSGFRYFEDDNVYSEEPAMENFQDFRLFNKFVTQ